MDPDADSQLGATDLVLPRSLYEQRLSHIIGYARPQKRESWWYPLWNEALNYLCLATSIGAEGTGIRMEDKGRGVSFLLCPQHELLRDVSQPWGGKGNVAKVKREEIISWGEQVGAAVPPDQVPTDVDIHLERSNRQRRRELPEEDPLANLSFTITDTSDTEPEQKFKQPDFVILGRANDIPLHCHSVWEVKTQYSYGTSNLEGLDVQRVSGGVVNSALPQVSAQVLHVFHEYPTQQKVHCFILVDIYYTHLRYDRSDVPKDYANMDTDNFNELAGTIKPTFASKISPALQEGKDGKSAWFTVSFRADWQECMNDFMERK